MKILTTFIGTFLIISQLSCGIQLYHERYRSASYEYRKGLDYHGEGKFDQAIEAYTEAMEIDPNDVHAIYNRGLAHSAKVHPTLCNFRLHKSNKSHAKTIPTFI